MEESVTPPLCIWKHPAALPRRMPSLQMCSAVRSSRALIFDVSYGGSVACEPNASRSPRPTKRLLPCSQYSGFSGDVRSSSKPACLCFPLAHQPIIIIILFLCCRPASVKCTKITITRALAPSHMMHLLYNVSVHEHTHVIRAGIYCENIKSLRPILHFSSAPS